MSIQNRFGAAVAGASNLMERQALSGKRFSAYDHYKAHDVEANATADEVLKGFPAETAKKINLFVNKCRRRKTTVQKFKKNGNYTKKRNELHAVIIEKYINEEIISDKFPIPGKRPKFIIIGGRGGSGKSWFANNVYDPRKFVVLDADDIKGCLPEYEGWNAAQVHEESGDIFDAVTEAAIALGCNIVHDATMKTTQKARELVERFRKAGYCVEAHYMHLPRVEAAKRAVGRFLGPSKRLVPPEVILANTTNEQTFDVLRDLVDAWTFYDNQVQPGQEPKLIKRG